MGTRRGAAAGAVVVAPGTLRTASPAPPPGPRIHQGVDPPSLVDDDEASPRTRRRQGVDEDASPTKRRRERVGENASTRRRRQGRVANEASARARRAAEQALSRRCRGGSVAEEASPRRRRRGGFDEDASPRMLRRTHVAEEFKKAGSRRRGQVGVAEVVSSRGWCQGGGVAERMSTRMEAR